MFNYDYSFKVRTYTHKNNWGLGWGEGYINPPKGPPSGSHIENDDDWAAAPPKANGRASI